MQWGVRATAPIPTAAAPASQELDALTRLRATRRDQRACRALVACYQHRVYALVGRMLQPRGLDAQVDDVAQETFLRVFRHLDRFVDDGRARLSTWILTIATRLCIDAIRRAERPSVAGAPQPDQARRPDQAHAQRSRLAATQAAIAALPPEHQAVLVLRAFHDLDYPEIGAALDLAPGTVKSRLARARARLRELLEAPR